MSNLTKKALAQAITEMLEEHPLDKITIRDLTGACGLTRNTFYYHFHDVYELLSWTFQDQTDTIMRKYTEKEDWQGGLEEALSFLYSHRRMIVHVSRSVSYVDLFRFVDEIMLRHAKGVVALEAENLHKDGLSDEVIGLTADFYTNAIIGAVFSWIRDDMPQPPAELARRFNEIFKGTVEAALESAARAI